MSRKTSSGGSNQFPSDGHVVTHLKSTVWSSFLATMKSVSLSTSRSPTRCTMTSGARYQDRTTGNYWAFPATAHRNRGADAFKDIGLERRADRKDADWDGRFRWPNPLEHNPLIRQSGNGVLERARDSRHPDLNICIRSSPVFGTLNPGSIVMPCPRAVRSPKIGTTDAPVSRAILTIPGGSVVSRPKNDTGRPF